MSFDLLAPGCQALLLQFDVADPGHLGWFSRCQFYVDGRTGSVLEEPISVFAFRYNLLNTDVGVCGGTVVKPPASRTESMGARN